MEQAEAMISDVDFEIFKENYQINFVVVRALKIIGKVTKQVPESFRTKFSEIPWKDMAGFRDRIIHGYDAVNFESEIVALIV